MDKASFGTDEQQMKLLKDKAIFADSEYARFQSVKALATFGDAAEPFVSEVLESTSDAGFRRLCLEVLERVKRSPPKRLLGLILALAPYLVMSSCTLDYIPS